MKEEKGPQLQALFCLYALHHDASASASAARMI